MNMIARRFISVSTMTILLSACGGSDTQEANAPPPLRPVKTLQVVSAQSQNIRQLPGVVDAVRKAELAFRVSGVVKKLPIKEGDEVQKGQLLAELDQTDFAIQLDKDDANFESAESAYLRGQTLVDEGHISKADYETLTATFNTAKAQLSASKQNMKYTRLVAPFSGVVAAHHVERFEEINAKQTIISIQDLSKLLVTIDVPESLMIDVRGDEEKPYTSYATFDAIQDEQFPLTFKEASTKADDATKTFKVSLTMSNSTDYSILPGMSATVHAKRNISSNVPSTFHIPSQAVLADNNGRFVFIAEPDSSPEAVVRRQAVEVGQLTAEGLIINKGLADGDHVIIAGMSKMRDGLRVRLNNQ